MLPPRVHDFAVRSAEGLCVFAGASAGFVLGLVSFEPVLGPDAQFRLAHLALLGVPSLAGVFVGFLVGAWVPRRLPARCHCGLRARRVSSSPIEYLCALSHTTLLDVPTPKAPLFDDIREWLDRPAALRVQRDREREEARAKAAPEGSVSLATPPSHEGAVSLPVESGAVSIADGANVRRDRRG